MSNQEFTLRLNNITDFSDELADRIYEAGCDDATLLRRNNVVYLFFDREADTLHEAITSATEQLNSISITTELVEE